MKHDIDFERIAAQIHEFYFARFGGFLPARFAELPEFMKADNRAAAHRIEDVLAIAGLCIAKRENGSWPLDEQQVIRAVMEENIDNLAEAEHDGWVETRQRQGWVLTSAPKNSDDKRANFDRRKHHLLIPYADLPQSEQRKDQDVRNYVEIIDHTAYRIVVKKHA